MLTVKQNFLKIISNGVIKYSSYPSSIRILHKHTLLIMLSVLRLMVSNSSAQLLIHKQKYSSCLFTLRFFFCS